MRIRSLVLELLFVYRLEEQFYWALSRDANSLNKIIGVDISGMYWNILPLLYA
jgi:hypothetical protein